MDQIPKIEEDISWKKDHPNNWRPSENILLSIVKVIWGPLLKLLIIMNQTVNSIQKLMEKSKTLKHEI